MNINAEYLSEWLIQVLKTVETDTADANVWRTSPEKSGISNCVGDIGTHIEDTVAYITGLHPKKVAAVLDTYGMSLDLNANILVEYENGVHGVYSCSQVCAGQPVQRYYRGMDCIKGLPAAYNHLPSGHPEGMTYAFANIYYAFMQDVLSCVNGRIPEKRGDYPSVSDGRAGVQFVHAAVKSSKNGAVWVEV